MSLANPPVDVGVLAFVGFVPLLWVLQNAPRGRAAMASAVFALVYYGILLSWLIRFGVVAWAPLVVVESLYAVGFGAVYPFVRGRGSTWRSALAAAALWTALEWVRASWPMGGFTWGGFGYTQHDADVLLPLASVTGVWGLTFVVVLVNGLVVAAVDGVRAAPRRAAGLAAVALTVAVAPVAIPTPDPAGPALDIALVQGNVPPELADQRYLQTEVVAENHMRLHASLAEDPPDLAVWPENALDDDPSLDRELGAAVGETISSVGAPTLMGAITGSPDTGFFNQVLFYSGKGDIQGRYTKNHLVPFGEYVPFRRYFGWVDELRAVPRDLIPGRGIRLFDVGGVGVGTPICFENVFPDLFRRFVDAGAGVVVVTTNDSSYATSPASREHVIMSEIRAVETGRWVLQAAISGISAVVSPEGVVVAETGLFEEAILRHPVTVSDARTIYTRVGDVFPWACAIGVAIVLAMGGPRAIRRRGTGADRRSGAPPAGEGAAGRRAVDRARQPISGGSGEGDTRVLVVLPTYNERDTIGTVIEGVLGTGPSVDVLVIDDASPDGTGDVVAGVAAGEPRVRLLRRSAKQGLASAYLAGFRRGLEEGYDVLVEMDSDLSHLPEELPRLLDGVRRFDLTIGSRYVEGGVVTNWSRGRLGLSKAGNAYARIALGVPLTDMTSGFRAFRRDTLERLLERDLTSDGYAFQIELAYRAHRAGLSVGEVPITFREREHGRSKISRRIVAEALWRVGVWGLRDRMKVAGRGGERPVRGRT